MIYMVLKRIFDFTFSCIAFIVLFPIFLITSIGIYISSPGPVFFKANRIGRSGKKFIMYKFRSMHLNNEKGHIITLRSDSRVFPFGSFIRKAKIDELPQLINILKGDMSIVGWRPEDEENAPLVFVGKYKEILKSKPGLTSPGSLYDYTHGEVFENEEEYLNKFMPLKMELELYYVNHMSIHYDIELIFRTIKTIMAVVLGGGKLNPPRELSFIQEDNQNEKKS